MIEIREKQNGYGLIIALLLIIIMILVSYIAYNKGLDKKDNNKETTTTVKTTTTAEVKMENKEYTYQSICDEQVKCNEEIFETSDLKIKIESDEVKHKVITSGLIEKTIELEKFISLRVLDNKFYIIKSSEKENKENYILTLYDEKLNKLDKLNINIFKKESFDNLNLTYFTYDIKCPDNQDDYFIKETAIISDNGFVITSSNKGPLKTEGIVCKKITTN